MLLKITDAEYLGSFRIRLVFSDGRVGEVDGRFLAEGPPQAVFGALADEAFFRQFALEHGTLSWPGERDVAAEYLYFLAFRGDPALQSLFRQWGYLDDRPGSLAA